MFRSYSVDNLREATKANYKGYKSPRGMASNKCVHKGCGKVYTDPDEECVYHPGPPVFHEGQKGVWLQLLSISPLPYCCLYFSIQLPPSVIVDVDWFLRLGLAEQQLMTVD